MPCGVKRNEMKLVAMTMKKANGGARVWKDALAETRWIRDNMPGDKIS